MSEVDQIDNVMTLEDLFLSAEFGKTVVEEPTPVVTSRCSWRRRWGHLCCPWRRFRQQPVPTTPRRTCVGTAPLPRPAAWLLHC